MKRVELFGRLLSSAFVVALWMEPLLISIPSEDLNRLDSVIVKRPEPEYASIRCVMAWFGVVGRMWSRIYCVKTGRIELLFWKNEPAGLTNWNV
jgi:hypothetical protein